MSMPSADKPEEVSREEWIQRLQNTHITRADMNKLIMNYLVTEGFKEAAEKFRMEAGVTPPIELEALDNRIQLRSLVQNGRIQEAILMVNKLYPELLDNDRYLFFRLQQQKLIELIRDKDIEGALEYAQNYLSERGEENPDVLNELEKTLALLAFENPENSPFGELLHPSQRQKVASELNAAILELDATPRLASLLKLLLWGQVELDKRKVKYPHMTDIAQGKIEDPK
ncbi:glucose-induced degradation protein 8 homolog isoform X2 [Pomacea canaliculata]|nr:glucose-induced degradation protein 8 homolog isoform X2 [Pomacea canaliculata]XP_025086616.1 glucose-induced degradation protein 8 homolog isoform X2 [Pomacea canaliculata]XP_025086617.1 glucose-induced degradation protein 8 homolog isoform X2 [Pomacea canaliculata]